MTSEYDTPIFHRLNISANIISRELGKWSFPGVGPSLSDRSPSKAYFVKFSARFDEASRSSPNLIDYPLRLNISAKIISRELGEPDYSRGRDRPHSIDLPREHIV